MFFQTHTHSSVWVFFHVCIPQNSNFPQVFSRACAKRLHTCGLFKAYSFCIMLCLASAATLIVLQRVRQVSGVPPGFCMDAGGLLVGEAILRKIFCLQETLRGGAGRPPALSESLLQPDKLLFLPSPLLGESTAASQTPEKRGGRHVTPATFQHPFTYAHTHILQYACAHTVHPACPHRECLI